MTQSTRIVIAAWTSTDGSNLRITVLADTANHSRFLVEKQCKDSLGEISWQYIEATTERRALESYFNYLRAERKKELG